MGAISIRNFTYFSYFYLLLLIKILETSAGSIDLIFLASLIGNLFLFDYSKTCAAELRYFYLRISFPLSSFRKPLSPRYF